MLKYRLFFGILMIVSFAVVAAVDAWITNLLATAGIDGGPVRGTAICILVAALIVPAQLELARIAAAKNLDIFLPVTLAASIILGTFSYWPQILPLSPAITLMLLAALVLSALFLCQYLRHGTSSVLANCGAGCLSICYVGLLIGFVPAIRIDFGLKPMLMFVFVVKGADIGAYAIGKTFGKHKFSPRISPRKTWEGLAGAMAAAAIVAVFFTRLFGIMSWWLAVLYGVCFAFIGQISDLAESLMKRDAEQKDSANKLPGFGGILDIIDSPIGAAPFAYVFFLFAN
ncbi:MAG: phosphatidate cytidylyltransferase [Phycisphaerales bacterium]|nr:MAG: phosphatidate cytidylyltransferase [Phycisphaerales bacterium]